MTMPLLKPLLEVHGHHKEEYARVAKLDYQKTSYLRSKAILVLTKECVKEFLDHEEELLVAIPPLITSSVVGTASLFRVIACMLTRFLLRTPFNCRAAAGPVVLCDPIDAYTNRPGPDLWPRA